MRPTDWVRPMGAQDAAAYLREYRTTVWSGGASRAKRKRLARRVLAAWRAGRRAFADAVLE